MKQLFKAGIWIFIGLAVVFFWLSIRSPTDQMEYSITALALWAVGMLFNYLLKKQNKEENN